MVYALRPDGTVADLVSQAVRLDLDRVEGAIARGGVLFFGRLTLPVGRYRLRTVLQDAYSGRHGLTTVEIAVPAADAGPLLAPLMVARSGGSGLLITADEHGRTKPPYPFSHGRERYVPVTRLEAAFGRRSQAAPGASRRVLAVARTGPTGRLRAWLEDARGRPQPVPVELYGRPVVSADGALHAVLDVPPDLDEGSRRLIVEVEEHGRTARRELAWHAFE